MKSSIFRYPVMIRMMKHLYELFTILLILITLYTWGTSRPGDFKSPFEYVFLVISLPLSCFFVFWSRYTWSDIKLSENGIFVEFLIHDLFVPWEDLLSIKYIGLPIFGSWLVRTRRNRLTPFHRTYDLLYTFSFNPSFVIRPQINGEKELIKMINHKLRERPIRMEDEITRA